MKEPFDLPKAYDPKETDNKWYSFWEKNDFFKADSTSKKPAYTIVMPPPNVTGALHMGHALVSTLQDILIRWKRMQGFEALWIPGTDHAGIATQTVVERHLMKTTGKRRVDFDRDEFLSQVWHWKETHENRILDQLKQMGSSCDWSRLRFTMDEGCNLAVRTIFKKLFEKGLIYRGDYLVNWDPLTHTALADDEVEYEERDTFIWTFKFPLENSSETIAIATTRPETMFGDVAVAVSPKDPRYASLIGKNVLHPLTKKLLPIIGDNFVDISFGTGAVKITPAHDPTDYKIGLHHKLPLINIYTPDLRLNEHALSCQGMTCEEARPRVVEELKSQGLLVKIEPHRRRVGVSYRSKAVIEPCLSKQWFIKMEPFIPKLKSAVREGKVKLIPPSWESTYFHWVDHLRDWCISRQLWWGHRIPVWHHKHHPEKMICYEGIGIPPEIAHEIDLWEQDPDVLDTWFSSGLWPFSTLGWPHETPELKKFYPNSVLVTGHDILFFWVARMILMGEFAMDQVPFPETFLHGLIYGKSYWRNNPQGGITYVSLEERAAFDQGKTLPADVHHKWEKLSKSKGNVIDPIEMISEYGTDAVRMSLCSTANQTPQIDLDRRRFEEFKNFANKIWNGARFVFMNLEGLTECEFMEGLDLKNLSLEDHWILSCLNHTNKAVNRTLADYSFDKASELAYNFFWKEFCAYYLEIAKPQLFGKSGTPQEKKNKQKLLVILLSNAIRLLHPMAPFITEELFQLLKTRFPHLKINSTSDPYTQETIEALLKQACIVAPYPRVIVEADIQPEIEENFSLFEKIIYTVRNIRGEMKIPPHLATDIYLVSKIEMLNKNKRIISALVKTNAIEVVQSAPNISGFTATGVVSDITIIIPLPSEMAAAEKGRLEKEKEKLSQIISRLQTQLANEEFLSKASPEVITKQKEQLATALNELSEISKKLFSP